jgi:serine/threonine protein kinase
MFDSFSSVSRDPNMRLTAEELLCHPFIERYCSQSDSSKSFQGMFKTSDAATTRLFGSILRHMNPEEDADSRLDRARQPLCGLSESQIEQICDQLPGLNFEHARSLHDGACSSLAAVRATETQRRAASRAGAAAAAAREASGETTRYSSTSRLRSNRGNERGSYGR